MNTTYRRYQRITDLSIDTVRPADYHIGIMHTLTTADIAARTGKPQTSIARRARMTGIGRRIGRDWIFSAAEAEKLIKRLRPAAGNPNFVRKKR